jgi:LemA protein
VTDRQLLLIVVLGVGVGGLVWARNSFVRLAVRANNAWSDIDVQLRRRYDLVPNLVATVQQYAKHESATFEEVARQRSAVEQANRVANREEAENALEGGLRSVFALAEAYPELRAADNFRDLQRQLVDIENDLQHARRYYNAVVRDLNTKLQSFPIGILGRLTGIREREFFQIDKEVREAHVTASFQ